MVAPALTWFLAAASQHQLAEPSQTRAHPITCTHSTGSSGHPAPRHGSPARRTIATCCGRPQLLRKKRQRKQWLWAGAPCKHPALVSTLLACTLPSSRLSQGFCGFFPFQSWLPVTVGVRLLPSESDGLCSTMLLLYFYDSTGPSPVRCFAQCSGNSSSRGRALTSPALSPALFWGSQHPAVGGSCWDERTVNLRFVLLNGLQPFEGWSGPKPLVSAHTKTTGQGPLDMQPGIPEVPRTGSPIPLMWQVPRVLQASQGVLKGFLGACPPVQA